MVDKLPDSVTHNDLRNLVHKAVFSGYKLEKRQERVYSDSSLRGKELVAKNMSDIRLLRSPFLFPTGKALLSFTFADSAQGFSDRADGQWIGGRRVKARVVRREEVEKEMHRLVSGVRSHAPADGSMTPLQTLSAMQDRAPGRVVLLRGIPFAVHADRMERLLRSAYAIPPAEQGNKGVAGRVPPIVKLHAFAPVTSSATYLVELETVSDAMRLVRRWHLQPYLVNPEKETQHVTDEANTEEVEDVKSDYNERGGEGGDAEKLNAAFDKLSLRKGSDELAADLNLHVTRHITQASIMY